MSAPPAWSLGTRTVFNLLGPLSNPAGVKRQVTGVFSKTWVEPLAHVLKSLGSEACWICHGEGGVDEIVPTGTTWISELKNGEIRSFEVTPESVGMTRSKPETSQGWRSCGKCDRTEVCTWKANRLPFADAAMP